MKNERRYLSREYFTNDFTFMERAAFAMKYSDHKWDSALQFAGYGRNRISKSAIKVAEVLNPKLELNLFPMIIPVATKGWDMSGGTASFMMYDDKGHDYLFETRAAQCKSASGKYYLRIDNGQCWIGREF